MGGHHGETAVALTRAFPGVKVYSFEPLPESYAILREATAGMNVLAVNAAVSDRIGSLSIGVGSRNTGKTGVSADGPKVEVLATTIDDYVAETDIQAQLLKIDVEGHEEAVLRGARHTLRERPPEFILSEVEFTPRDEEPHGDFNAIFAVLAPLGYRIVSFYSGGVDSLGWLWGDVLFRHCGQEREPWYSRSPHAQRIPIPA